MYSYLYLQNKQKFASCFFLRHILVCHTVSLFYFFLLYLLGQCNDLLFPWWSKCAWIQNNLASLSPSFIFYTTHLKFSKVMWFSCLTAANAWWTSNLFSFIHLFNCHDNELHVGLKDQTLLITVLFTSLSQVFSNDQVPTYSPLMISSISLWYIFHTFLVLSSFAKICFLLFPSCSTFYRNWFSDQPLHGLLVEFPS